MVYCKHCGKEFSADEIIYCPSCGKPQYQSQELTRPMVVTQNKNPGTAVLIALIAGFFGFQGIGHMYIGKTGIGIGLLLMGWFLGISIVLFTLGGILPMTILLGIIILAYWIWQAYDVNKLAKYYNEYLMQNGKGPW
jgi:hypothetical protein